MDTLPECPEPEDAGKLRIGISPEGKFVLNGEQVQLYGSNYVVKAPPYYPPDGVVRQDAQKMANAMPAPLPDGKVPDYKPCVRLGALWEAAMPEPGGKIDSKFMEKLEVVIEIFKSEGVYVFLDNHLDNMCSSFGGQGMPAWVAMHFQDTAGCGCCASCSCCWGRNCGTKCAPSYVVAPSIPLQNVCCNHCTCIMSRIEKKTGAHVVFKTVADDKDAPEKERKNPWKAFAPGQDAGDPARMNIGNASMRMNNNDWVQRGGSTQFSLQCQNFGYRLYNSPWHSVDREVVFEPFVGFIQYLCRLWSDHWNVIAIEPFNEPNIAAIPDLVPLWKCQRAYLWFWGALMEALDKSQPKIEAPLAVEFIGGTLPGASKMMKLLDMWPWPSSTRKLFHERARRGQLILSFHHHKSFVTTLDLENMVKLARNIAQRMGGCPLWLSEGTSQDPITIGVDAVTYWHWVNQSYTNGGWVRYDNNTDPFHHGGGEDWQINWSHWKAYADSVANGTFWGGMINGSGGGKTKILGNGLPPSTNPNV